MIIILDFFNHNYIYIGHVWVNNLIKHLFYKILLDENLCHK